MGHGLGWYSLINIWPILVTFGLFLKLIWEQFGVIFEADLGSAIHYFKADLKSLLLVMVLKAAYGFVWVNLWVNVHSLFHLIWD